MNVWKGLFFRLGWKCFWIDILLDKLSERMQPIMNCKCFTCGEERFPFVERAFLSFRGTFQTGFLAPLPSERLQVRHVCINSLRFCAFLQFKCFKELSRMGTNEGSISISSFSKMEGSLLRECLKLFLPISSFLNATEWLNLTLPYLFLPFLSYLFLPYLFLPYLTFSYLFLHYLLLPFHTLPYLALLTEPRFLLSKVQ